MDALRAGLARTRLVALTPALLLAILLPFLTGVPASAPEDAPAVVRPNPNTRAAGLLSRDTLRVSLVATLGRWFPEADGGPSVVVQAFAEEGGIPSIPGPLVRVTEGTVIVATVRNALSGDTLVVRGLQSRPAGAEDTLQVAPGASRTVRFPAGAAGTYFYWATTTDRPQRDREGIDSQLSGAFVVDPPGGPARPDRIFVMGAFSEPLDTARDVWREALVINGRSWPHTERVDLVQGDTAEWRWINANDRPHPMHLHGFYYEILGLGDAMRDTPQPAGALPLVVTHRMPRWTTMRIRFVPHTAGNWVFHCHILFHIESPGLDPVAADSAHRARGAHGMDDMRGLVLGIRVRAGGAGGAALRPGPRQLRLLVQERPRVYGDTSGFGFVLQEGAEPPPDSVAIPGPPIVLTRDEPVHITVVNRLREPTAVHWHGLELESYFDGVAGLSGRDGRVAPPIMPGDSFVVEMQPPRAGTFIYHTHFSDIRQTSRGLYGPLIVLEPGQRRDPATDLVWLHSSNPSMADDSSLFNGRIEGQPPIVLQAGRPHRIRLIGFPVAASRAFALMRGDTLASWRALAKDGADLAPELRTQRPARQMVTVGETYDFEFVPAVGDRLRVELRIPGGRTLIAVPVVVR